MFVKLFFFFKVCFVCWHINLNYGGIQVLSIKSCSNYSLIHSGAHSLKHLSRPLARISATPLSCQFSLPENSIVSPVDVLNLPWPVHRNSLTPSMLKLYLCISAVSIAALPTSFNVRAFQQPILFLFFVLNMFWVDTIREHLCPLLIKVLASSWL